MQEIELKILKIDPLEVDTKLLAMGAKKEPTVFVIDKTFDFHNHALAKKNNALRLRQMGEKTYITYKGGVQKGKIANIIEEIETSVGDVVVFELILKKLGMQCYKHREKKRTSYSLPNIHCEIDEYPGIPPYLEIEGPQKDIQNVVEKLGFNLSDTTRASVSKVLKKYNIKSDSLKFQE